MTSPVFDALTGQTGLGQGASSPLRFRTVGTDVTNAGFTETPPFVSMGRNYDRGSSTLRVESYGRDVANAGLSIAGPFSSYGRSLDILPDIGVGASSIYLTTVSHTYDEDFDSAFSAMPTPETFGTDVTNRGQSTAKPFRTFGTDVPPPVADLMMLLFQGAGWLTLTIGYQLVNIEEELHLGDSLKTTIAYGMHDTVALGDQIVTRGDLAIAITDALGFGDRLGFQFTQFLIDSLAFSDGVSLTLNLAALADILVLADVAPSTLQAYQQIATALLLADAADGTLILSLEDSVALADQLGSAWQAKLDLLDAISFDDSLTGTFTLMCLLPDSFDLTDSGSSTIDAVSVLEDSIGLSVRLQTDEGVYVAYAINTATKGASRYLNYNFNSFAEINGRLLGASQNGLFAVSEGKDDDGVDIPARVRTGLDNLGTTQLKRMFQAYLGYRTNGDMLLKVIISSPQGVKQDYTYKVTTVRATDGRNSKVKIGKGLNSVYWAFEVANVDGSEFMLDTLSIIPLISGRRFNG